MFKFHTKQIYTKYDKIYVFEKSSHKNYHGEKKSRAKWSGILCYAKACPICLGLYRLIFQSLYDTSLVTPRWEVDGTVNFHNFRKLFTNKCLTFFGPFGTLFSNGENEMKRQDTWSMLQWPSVNGSDNQNE